MLISQLYSGALTITPTQYKGVTEEIREKLWFEISENEKNTFIYLCGYNVEKAKQCLYLQVDYEYIHNLRKEADKFLSSKRRKSLAEQTFEFDEIAKRLDLLLYERQNLVSQYIVQQTDEVIEPLRRLSTEIIMVESSLGNKLWDMLTQGEQDVLMGAVGQKEDKAKKLLMKRICKSRLPNSSSPIASVICLRFKTLSSSPINSNKIKVKEACELLKKGESALYQEDYKEAVFCFTRGLRIVERLPGLGLVDRPLVPTATTYAPAFIAACNTGLSIALSSLHKYEEALIFAEEALTFYEVLHVHVTYMYSAETWEWFMATFGKGIALLGLGKSKEAIGFIQKAKKMLPDIPLGKVWHANCEYNIRLVESLLRSKQAKKKWWQFWKRDADSYFPATLPTTNPSDKAPTKEELQIIKTAFGDGLKAVSYTHLTLPTN